MTQDTNFPLDNPSGTRVHVSDINAKLIANAQDAETRLTATAAAASAASALAAAAYVKPAPGIPSSDLTAGVQTSLGKADSAVQSVKSINGKTLAGTGDAGIVPADVGAAPAGTGTAGAITKSDVGLGSADNTADVSKPVSGPQATAISTAVATRIPVAPVFVTAGRALTVADAGATIINSSSPAASASFSLIPGLGQVFLEQKLGTAPLAITLGTATTLTGMTSTSLTFPRIRVVEVAAGVYRGEADSWAFPDPSVPGDLEDALDAAHASSTPLTIFGMPNAKYTLVRQANVDVYKTSMLGFNNSIDCAAVTYGPALTFGYTSSFSSGPEIRKAKARRFEGWEVYGNLTTNVPGTIGLWTHGAIPNNAPRPTFRDFFVHDFETGIGGRDQFYLSQLDGLESYSCVFGFWQQCGSDAGESIIINGGVLDNNWCAIRMDDPSSELVVTGTSTDYCRQRLVVHNQTKITFYAAHDENRGKNLGSDPNNYILSGSGSDSRAAIQGFTTWTDGQRFIWSPIATNTSTTVTMAPSGGLASKTIKKWLNGIVGGSVVALAVGDIVNGVPMEVQYNLANDCLIWVQTRTYYNMPCATQIGGSANAVTCSAFVTRDVFMDCDGDGTVVRCDGGNFNINASGGAGPYTYYRLVKVRHAGTRVIFDRVYKENSLNIADHFWDGPGVVITNFLTRAGSNPSNVNCYNHQSAYNLIADPGFSLALGKAAIWWIRLDTNSTIPTSRYTGTDGSIATVTPSVGNATSTTWSIAGEVLTVGGTIANKFVRGMTISGTGVTACKIIGPLTDTTGGAGDYLIETAQTVAGSGTLTGTISKALQITRTATATDATGKLNISTITRMVTDRRVASKFLIMIPSTGGMSTGNVFLNVQYARMSPDNDANGVPQVVELFNAWAAQTINTSTFTKDVWVDLPLAAFGVGVDAPPGATHVLWDFNTQNVSSTSGGVLLCSQQHASLG